MDKNAYRFIFALKIKELCMKENFNYEGNTIIV